VTNRGRQAPAAVGRGKRQREHRRSHAPPRDCSAQLAVTLGGLATVTGDSTVGAPAAASCGNGASPARTQRGAARCEGCSGAVISVGEWAEQCLQWRAALLHGSRPWRWRAPVPWSLGERARRAEHDAARAVVLVVGCQGARRWRDDGGGSELHGRPCRFPWLLRSGAFEREEKATVGSTASTSMQGGAGHTSRKVGARARHGCHALGHASPFAAIQRTHGGRR
jgi:hypothetical protein